MRRKLIQLLFILLVPSCILLIFIYDFITKFYGDYNVFHLLQNVESQKIKIEELELRLSFVHNNEDICNPQNKTVLNSTSLLLVNLVVSARHNFQFRETIRSTWGSRSKYGEFQFRLAFILGASNPHESFKIQDQLEEEIRIHNDIIIGNFSDIYRNLNYKHLLGYKWILQHCPNATVVVKSDDDVFINVFELVKFVSENQPLHGIHCWVLKRGPPSRYNESKWYVTLGEFPFNTYPDYCMGAGYLTTPDLMEKMYNVRGLVKYLWVEDVFVTGILRSHPKIDTMVKLENMRGRYTFYTNETESNWDEELIFIIVPHKSHELAFYSLWRKVSMENNLK